MTDEKSKEDVLKPSAALLVKLGSIIIHYEEYHSSDGHPFDKRSIDTLMADPDVMDWVRGMNELALLPLKRKK